MTQSEKKKQGREVGVERQINLPWSKALEIAYRSMRVRLGRSIITMVGVILAVAFMMSILTTDTIMQTLMERAKTDMDIGFALLRIDRIDVTAVAEAQDAEDKRDEMKQTQIWLISLSLAVAFIGIVNAMLMSVTERFREIGTMKCLGALDSFITRLFFLESVFQGMLGTLIGIAIGLGVSVAWKGIRYGTGSFMSGDLWLMVLRHSAFAFVVGTLISVLAAYFPARSAARMAPVDAMRADE